jgi:hypothetical protein
MKKIAANRNYKLAQEDQSVPTPSPTRIADVSSNLLRERLKEIAAELNELAQDNEGDPAAIAARAAATTLANATKG